MSSCFSGSSGNDIPTTSRSTSLVRHARSCTRSRERMSPRAMGPSSYALASSSARPRGLYRSVAELQRRELVQQRSVWRAVLPHAIANRLAATALQNIPYDEIAKHLMTRSAERLMRSLSRRLGYLHASKEAVAIVRNWLGVAVSWRRWPSSMTLAARCSRMLLLLCLRMRCNA